MRIFVYGTLMRGFGNYERFLKGNSTYVGPGETQPDFTMLSLGGFPGIVIGGKTAIKGEVFEITKKVRDDLDRLEGHPSFYARTLIILKDGSQAEAYVLAKDPRKEHRQLPDVPSGDWRAYYNAQGIKQKNGW